MTGRPFDDTVFYVTECAIMLFTCYCKLVAVWPTLGRRKQGFKMEMMIKVKEDPSYFYYFYYYFIKKERNSNIKTR